MTSRFKISTRMANPGLLTRSVFDDVFSELFDSHSLPALLKQSTQGYPVADIYQDQGNTIMEFALAGFSKEDLNVEVKPEKQTIVVRATTKEEQDSEQSRRIARRNFEKTYVNYNNNLDLSSTSAKFENGLLRIVVPARAESRPKTISIT